MEEDKIMLIKTLDEILSVKERRSFFYSSVAEISYIPKDVKASNRCLRGIDILKEVVG